MTNRDQAVSGRRLQPSLAAADQLQLQQPQPPPQPQLLSRAQQRFIVRRKIGLERKPNAPLASLSMPGLHSSCDTGLIGVCLVIRSRDGPRFVFHHPPRPITDAVKSLGMQGTEIDQSELEDVEEEDDETSDSDLEDDGPYHLHANLGHLDLAAKGADKPQDRKRDHVDPYEGDDHYDGPDGEQVVPWEHVFDFPTKDLESILTPSRAYHKKRFQLHLDPLYFLTYPVHIREDGTWKKKKKSKKNQKTKEAAGSEVNGESMNADHDAAQAEKNGNAAKVLSDDEDDHGGMTMFNAVFVMSIPEDGTDDNTYVRIQDMYDNVAKDFNKALKHAQAQSNYVWKESELILAMKEKAREERRPMSWLWNEILAKSSLAGAIRDVSEAITRSKIATIHLATNPSVDLSLQIPIPFYLSQIPSIIRPGLENKAMPGVLLTTAEPRLDDEGNLDFSHLNKHFALLLMDDKDKIISEIQADNTELSAPLIEYIKLSPPTMSFLQVAQANSISLNDVKTLAQHLIYWRRAIPIPPLHARDTFIVSPNCDSRQLPNASVAWTKAFPLAPSLPTFLATLSAAPRPYKTFFPSKDHRSQYMDMLAWLLRGGWVTQLRTFCWIMVWPEIIYEVEYDIMSQQVKESREPKKKRSPETSSSSESTDESGSDKRKAIDPTAPLTTEQIAEEARLERIAAKAAAELAAFTQEFQRKPLPQSTAHPSFNNAPHLADIAPHIIKDPHKIDQKDSLYMDAIAKRIADDKAKKNWPRFSKYFNGEDALESIAMKEGLKRKEAWGILAHYQEHLLISRHW